jgi:hypothetical protein
MTADFHNASHQEFADVMSAERKKFLVRVTTWSDTESKMRWILKHPLANASEKLAARGWLRSHGVTR